MGKVRPGRDGGEDKNNKEEDESEVGVGEVEQEN